MINNTYSTKNANRVKKYKIQKGDTPYKIAKQFKISLDDLVKLNPNLNPLGLNEGEFILINNIN